MTVLRAGSATDVGAVRATNEDSLLVRDRVFAIADGMGGHAAGEVASGTAVTALAALADLEAVGVDTVKQHVALANADILALADREPDKAGMGTTLTGLCLVEVGGIPHWAVFNLGDSPGLPVPRRNRGAVDRRPLRGRRPAARRADHRGPSAGAPRANGADQGAGGG